MSFEDQQNEYYMWRSLIAMAHADKRLMRQEQEFLKKEMESIDNMSLQYRLLDEMNEDMLNPKPADIFFELITDYDLRIQTLRKAYRLFWADGELHQAEQDVFDYIVKEILKDPDNKALLIEAMPAWTADSDVALRTLLEKELNT